MKTLQQVRLILVQTILYTRAHDQEPFFASISWLMDRRRMYSQNWQNDSSSHRQFVHKPIPSPQKEIFLPFLGRWVAFSWIRRDYLAAVILWRRGVQTRPWGKGLSFWKRLENENSSSERSSSCFISTCDVGNVVRVPEQNCVEP